MEAKKTNKKRSMWGDVLKRLMKNRMAVIGGIIVISLILIAICADFICDYEDEAIFQNVKIRLEGPSSVHILGTDEFGRDMFARIVHGSRISLLVGFFATMLAMILGLILGSSAGYFGGKIDMTIMRILDVFMAIPQLLLAITLVAAFGTSIGCLMIALGVSSVPSFSRMLRSQVITVKEQEFIEAARAIGAKDSHIITTHIIPNSLSPVIVQVSMRMASCILSISSLSFIGLGISPPTPEWGSMLSGGRMYLRDAEHITMYPGLAIMITILAFNLLGDGLRDALDPKLKR
jgi:peptide/nickel transport system permease protein